MIKFEVCVQALISVEFACCGVYPFKTVENSADIVAVARFFALYLNAVCNAAVKDDVSDIASLTGYFFGEFIYVRCICLYPFLSSRTVNRT